jgi:TatD DNase family protein
MFIDSHTHLYLDAFSDDRNEMMERALKAGVTRMLLPNIDMSTLPSMMELVDQYPEHCFPMMGLHPTSVEANYQEEFTQIEAQLREYPYKAIGETGIDLYWDKTYRNEQMEVFEKQIGWAIELKLPLVVHARDSFQEIFEVLDRNSSPDLQGVFHSFTGNRQELEKALSFDFMIGINGIVTFKNSNLKESVKEIPLDRLLLETDAPFLAPFPHRGRRNESSYLVDIAVQIAEIFNLSVEEIATITSRNAEKLFHLIPSL